MTLRRRRSTRGHALGLVLFAAAILSTVGAVVWTRLGVEHEQAARDDRRMRLVWLARSAATAGGEGEWVVDFDGRLARVSVTTDESKRPLRHVVAEASAEGWGRARVEADLDGETRVGWRESFASAHDGTAPPPTP